MSARPLMVIHLQLIEFLEENLQTCRFQKCEASTLSGEMENTQSLKNLGKKNMDALSAIEPILTSKENAGAYMWICHIGILKKSR